MTDPLAAAQSMTRLSTAASARLRGVAVNHASAVSAGPGQWRLQMALEAWRIDDGPVCLQRLMLHQPVDDAAFERQRDALAPYRVLDLRVRLLEDSAPGTPQALLEQVVGFDDADAELHAHAETLQQPVTHEDPQLGVFTLDRRVGWFSARTAWRGREVELQLEADQPDEVAAALQAAHALWADDAAWEQRVRAYAVDQLLPLKNAHWLESGETPLGPDAFAARMTLRSIGLTPEGGFDFWHDDGELFRGHAIRIGGTLAAGPNAADIPG